MLEVWRCVLPWLLLGSFICNVQPATVESAANITTSNGSETLPLSVKTSSQSLLASDRPNNATCGSRTVNYITHTLPQQCLRTDRVATNNTSNGTATTSEALIFSHDDRYPATTESSGNIHVNSTASNNESPLASTANETSLPIAETTTAGSLAHSTVSATRALDTAIAADDVSEAELDSPLDNANFLSFEEWKKQNLVKAGQSPDHVGQGRQIIGGERQRPGINNALDSLGEESEIDLDFSGFGGAQSKDASENRSTIPGTSETALSEQSSPGSVTHRSKDAGRTCKERTNYASFDCAAGVLKSNPECKSASSILVENKDSYMLNTCSAKNKFFIVELCNDILIDTVVLANYEFFSSIFRHFRVSVADRYPVKAEKWKDLGTFEARSTREVQAFLIENPLIWARYLRIEFLSHYGNEYYCPLSLLRVHGTTMMEEFRHQEELARGENPDDEIVIEDEVAAPSPAGQEYPSSASLGQTVASQPTKAPEIEASDSVTNTSTSTIVVDGSSCDSSAQSSLATHALSEIDVSTITSRATPSSPNDMTCAIRNAADVEQPPPDRDARPSSSPSSLSTNNTDSQSIDGVPSTMSSIVHNTTQSSSTNPTPTGSTTATFGMSDTNTPPASQPVSSNSSTAASHSSSSLPQEIVTNTTHATENSTRAVPATSTASHPPQPSTQESFFKSIHKRLQQLESNSTLSLQYIEEQSRILRDAFTKVEKRQVTATEKFLSHLNATVMGELHGFRQAYDQLWQSTVIELEGQREQYQREMLALSTRLTLVADELVWQKRMGIVQSTLLLLCLALVLFARQGNGYLEMPLAQQLMNKSQAAFRSGWDSEPNSPSPTNRSPVSLFRRNVLRTRTEAFSGDMTDATDSRPLTRDGLDVHVEPPTPPDDMVDEEEEEEDDIDDDDDDDVYEEPAEQWEGIQSGPATPNGTAAGLKRTPDLLGDTFARGTLGDH